MCYYCKKADSEVDMKGIEREIDPVGRVVIPMEFRKELGVEFNSKVLISLSDGEIVIRAKDTVCALCGEKIDAAKKLRLCESCIAKAKEL